MRTVKKKMSQEVSDGILELLRNGKYVPGNRIPTESELVDLFNVSRTAVREGVKSLVAIGVLETRRGIGTYVSTDSPGPLRYIDSASHQEKKVFLKDLLEFRMIVEPETVALAAQRRNQSDLDELKRCVEVLEKFVSNNENITGKPAEDLGFHLALAQATRNSALVDTSSMIARFYQDDPYPPDEDDVRDHRSIYEWVRDQNPEAARRAMQEHLLSQSEKYSDSQ